MQHHFPLLPEKTKVTCRVEAAAVVSNNISHHCVGNAGDIAPCHKGQSFVTQDKNRDRYGSLTTGKSAGRVNWYTETQGKWKVNTC